MTYQKAIDWLYSTQLFGIKLGLENPRRLLREYLAFPPRSTRVIHVAGTNGKGSTCAFIDSVSRATGCRTGIFTSPHLVRYNERVRISGVEISDEDVARHLTALRALTASWEAHPTFFELTLALAMKQFCESACEIVILETGMGGRLDATTAVPADVAVLTSIGLDHQQWLGESLPEIAAEKAAIIVPRKPVITTLQVPEVLSVIAQEANERRAPLEVVDEPLAGYSLGLPGEHQRLNAAAALAALHVLGVPLAYESVKAGLGNVIHPGRFETVPAAASRQLDIRGGITLDIAHNPAAAEALAATWRQHFGNRRAALVFGAVAAKDIAGMFVHLLPLASEVHLVPAGSPRAVPPVELHALLPDGHPPAHVHASLSGAFEALAGTAHPVLLTGSAFLVGAAKAHLQGAPHAPTAQ